jgi:lipopolysaccharide/colanic/teichoic acid biosynthesis glycosyltransferase
MVPGRRWEWVKRALDRTAATVGLIFLSPVLVLVATAILLEDGWPVFFRQERVGRNFRPFQLVKFRSMRANPGGARITAGHDPRITRLGRFLRRYKIDELPQLWNVVKGEMSLVGPRPEVPEYVTAGDPCWQAILQVRPGITDLASLVYRDEEEILARQSNPEQYYRESVLPEKQALNLQYLRSASLRLELKLILRTIHYSMAPAGFDAHRVRSEFSE